MSSWVSSLSERAARENSLAEEAMVERVSWVGVDGKLQELAGVGGSKRQIFSPMKVGCDWLAG